MAIPILHIKNFWITNILILTILLGIGFRFMVAMFGHNYDFESYLIVVKIVDQGGNVYAETSRYNYGPIWSYILFSLYNLSSKNEIIFRYLLVGFLSLVDVCIFSVLFQKFSQKSAYLFFFNPISIIVTGYHNQFDNLAILLAMISVLLIGDDFCHSFSRRKYFGLIALGISLATKHLFFAFPLWLAVKQKGIFWKIIIVLIPTVFFLLSFLPYWNTGKLGIIKNVFLYKSMQSDYFYKLFIPFVFQLVISSKTIWILLLIVCAFIFKNRTGIEFLLVYTIVLLMASPAIANQYLVIPIPFLSIYPNPFSVFFTVLGTWHLLIDGDGLQINSLRFMFYFHREADYAILVLLLCAAFIWTVWRQKIFLLLKNIFAEIRIQLEV